METGAQTASTSTQQKRKRGQVVAQETDSGASDPTMSLVIGKTAPNFKNDAGALGDMDQHLLKDALPVDPVDSKVTANNAPIDTSEHELVEENDDNDDETYEDYGDEDYGDEDYGDEDYGDDDEDYEYDTELIDADCNYNLASKFDDMELPPGVEATVPWLIPSETEKPSASKLKEVKDEKDVPYKDFKRFDFVQDASDHNYAKGGSKSVQPSKDLVKRIQHEWKILENDLPDTIFVRAYEDRMDLLRAAIIGPVGTPYHDGLFFFDAQFPPTYPAVPPVVYYHSGGLRLNPNLYNNGYVCLSLLGTWQGKGCEKWNPAHSTMLQVLVSIQALVLNDKPYFNEPGYERTSGTQEGARRSLKYNESTFVLSVRTMLYSLRRPPKHFENLVAEHFRIRGRTILAACKAYMDGVQVGCDVKDDDDNDKKEKEADDGEGGQSAMSAMTTFTHSVEKLFDDLLMEFTVKGADCAKFLAQKVKAGVAAAAKAAESSTRG